MQRPICLYCATQFIPVGNETICDLCVDTGITMDESSTNLIVKGFPYNPLNATHKIASCTVLDHAPTGSTRDEYFELRRELALKYGGRKGYADMSDFEGNDDDILDILRRCVEIRKNGKP